MIVNVVNAFVFSSLATLAAYPAGAPSTLRQNVDLVKLVNDTKWFLIYFGDITTFYGKFHVAEHFCLLRISRRGHSMDNRTHLWVNLLFLKYVDE